MIVMVAKVILGGLLRGKFCPKKEIGEIFMKEKNRKSTVTTRAKIRKNHTDG